MFVSWVGPVYLRWGKAAFSLNKAKSQKTYFMPRQLCCGTRGGRDLKGEGRANSAVASLPCPSGRLIRALQLASFDQILRTSQHPITLCLFLIVILSFLFLRNRLVVGENPNMAFCWAGFGKKRTCSCNVVFTFLFQHTTLQVVIDNSCWSFHSKLVESYQRIANVL